MIFEFLLFDNGTKSKRIYNNQENWKIGIYIISKQKKDDEEAKRRIREQIALDKAERQAKRQAELSLRQQLQQDKKEIFDNINHTDIINGRQVYLFFIYIKINRLDKLLMISGFING